MQLKIGDRELLTVVTFLGAGWSWPYIEYGEWYLRFWFHCKRGLMIGFGWYELLRRVRMVTKERLASMTEHNRSRSNDG